MVVLAGVLASFSQAAENSHDTNVATFAVSILISLQYSAKTTIEGSHHTTLLPTVWSGGAESQSNYQLSKSPMTATKAFSLSITPQVILIHINPRALIRGSGHTLLFSLSMKKKSWLFSAIVILEKDYPLIVAEIGKELWIAAAGVGNQFPISLFWKPVLFGFRLRIKSEFLIDMPRLWRHL